MKEKMGKPVMVAGESLGGMIERIKQKGIEARKKLEENKGRCIKCNKNMADLDSLIDPFRCEECNKETEKILKELKGQQGFVGFRILTRKE